MIRNSLSRKLTAMNLLVSGGALLLASLSFFTYELFAFRDNLISNTSIQAQIIGSNAVSPLVFNDSQSAETTLSALRASQHIVYAGIYTVNREFFAGYWRDRATTPPPLPFLAHGQRERSLFASGRFDMVELVEFQGQPLGIVYIRSDLGAMTERLRSYLLILVSIVTASLLAALMLSRIFQRIISQRILRLANIARRISTEKDYSIRVPPATDGDEVGVLFTSFNDMLQEIQKRDSALQESELQFRSLADSIPQLAWMAEPNGNLIWYNRRWYEYTGATPERMAGWGWQSVHDPQMLPDVVEKWRAALSAGQPFEMIFPLKGADGEFRQFLTLAVPIRDTAGQIVHWFGTNTDITDQRRAADALRQTEKLAATGRLAASIAHEINNPLEAVTNLVYLARKQPANVEKYLALADQELDRISQITKNTLGFYRDSASPTTVDIPQVLKEVLALYARKMQFKNITVRPDFAERLEISGYPGEIRQIFANLIANSIQALPENGVICIRTSRSQTLDGSSRHGARITFLDNGTGIPTAIRKKIFEPFYTTKKDVGTGLGLWLTLGLVEKHHGTLQVRSSVEPGNAWTAFSVFLPDHP